MRWILARWMPTRHIPNQRAEQFPSAPCGTRVRFTAPRRSAMLDRLLGRVHDTKHATPVLRGYLWWGLLLRIVLLVALGTLLVLEGNVLAEWLLTMRVPLVPQGGVEELTAISYTVIFVLLAGGAVARWQLLRRLDATERVPEEEASGVDD